MRAKWNFHHIWIVMAKLLVKWAPGSPIDFRCYILILVLSYSLLWRHNEHDSVSNHQPRGCLLNRLFRRRSKKTSKLRVTGLCVGNSPGPVNSPHKGPVTRKMFPFDDVIMFQTRFMHFMKSPRYTWNQRQNCRHFADGLSNAFNDCRLLYFDWHLFPSG